MLMLVESHIGDDYWVDADMFNEEEIEQTCSMCGDNDWVRGYVKNRTEAKKAIKHYANSRYRGYDKAYQAKLLRAYDEKARKVMVKP